MLWYFIKNNILIQSQPKQYHHHHHPYSICLVVENLNKKIRKINKFKKKRLGKFSMYGKMMNLIRHLINLHVRFIFRSMKENNNNNNRRTKKENFCQLKEKNHVVYLQVKEKRASFLHFGSMNGLNVTIPTIILVILIIS